jgi:hypothetical protein
MNYAMTQCISTHVTNIIWIEKKTCQWREGMKLTLCSHSSPWEYENVYVSSWTVRIRSPVAGSNHFTGPVPINIITTGALPTPTTIITVYQWECTVEGLLNWRKIHIFIEHAHGPCSERKALDGVWKRAFDGPIRWLNCTDFWTRARAAPRTRIRGWVRHFSS